jgi:tetratricopeptide (TPR) repeat protein
MSKLSVNEALLRAKSYERKGEINEARTLYQTVLQSFPGNARAKQALARLGGPQPPGATQDPPRETLDRISALYGQGQLAAAAAQVKTLVRQYPNSFTLWSMLGVLGVHDRDPAAAEAAFRKALGLNPRDPDTNNNLANALREQGKLEEAVAVYRRAIELKPGYAQAYNNLGTALRDVGDLDGAIASCRRAIELQPDYAGAHANLGNALRDRGDLEQAAASYRRTLAIQPDHAAAHNNLGNVQRDQGDLESAAASYRRALEIKPDYAVALRNLGNALDGQGKFGEAIACYRGALEIEPNYAECYRHLAAVLKFTVDAPEIKEMLRIHDDSRTRPQEKCHICFALGKAFEDIGETEKALSYFKEGNAIRKRLLNYDIKGDRELFASIRRAAGAIQTSGFEPSAAGEGTKPIFILGMPRSGTTLVEQIISSHSAVHGGGELPYVERYGADLAAGKLEPSKGNLAEFRKRYLESLASISNGCMYVSDKMPDNFRFIGLIAAALPEARIVHVRRDPAAVCWSNFKHYFSTSGLGFIYDLSDVVEYYRLHSDLMAEWSERFPGRIYDLDYEKLTESQERETRGLIDYIGLDWEDACLYPHENKRGVTTSSQQQIRQAVYKGSSASWKKYEPFLGGAFDVLRG